jgi:predicted nucleic acid-binding Zn finger protein
MQRIPQQDAGVKGSDGRYLRAVDLFWSSAFERESKVPEVWVMVTPYGSENRINVDEGTCTCRDYEINADKRNTREFMCKHKWSVNMKRIWLKQSTREIVEAGYFGCVA